MFTSLRTAAINSGRILALATATLATAWLGISQEKDEDKTISAAEVQEQLKQWVLTRQLISRERSNWNEQKETWAKLNEIRKQEIEQLGEFTAAAEGRVQELSEQQSQFSEEKKDLRSWRAQAVREIDQLETSLKSLLPRLPSPLQKSLREPILRLEEEAETSERSLQDRARDIVLILQAYREFQNTITVEREVLSLGGKEWEVEILYLGLTRAWFVDPQNQIAGFGLPTPTGWTWTEDAALAPSARRAIAMRKNEAPPQFLAIPLQLETEGAP